MVQYNHRMVFIGNFNKVVQIIDKWNVVINVLLLLLSCQTLHYFNECCVEIFFHYKDSDKKTKFEYVRIE